MSIAFETAKESDDPKAKIDPRSAVGAVIGREDKLLSKSANRLPPSLRSRYRIEGPQSEKRYYFLEHAERCAIFDANMARVPIEGATMYCTRFPCIDCARTISYFSLARLVVASGFSGEDKWISSQRAALELLRLSGVTVRYLKFVPLED